MREGETPAQFAIRIAAQLDNTALAIQGPPGAGKTYTGARMICELVRNGARVGVTALSHKVIGNLLKEVTEAADECGIKVACAQLTPDETPPGVEKITKNDAALARLSDRRANVVGGTSWLWADPRALNSVDVLFVDEAGQMPLANVLAASQAGGSVVLLGDPQQLDQPQQGSHPEGADVSALEHMLGDHKTIPSDRGIFLSETWRLAPSRGRVRVEQLRDFVDRIEVIYAWSQFVMDPQTNLPGSQLLSKIVRADRPYRFGGAEWKRRCEERRDLTALTAPINYGPGLKTLGWVEVHEQSADVLIPTPATTKVLDAFEAKMLTV